MPRPETGSFNRLITSLGLLFLAAALVIPYFYYRSTNVLEFTERELERLTPTARTSIERRQDHIAALQPYVLPLSAVLILGGTCFLTWGGLRLRDTQDLDDREAEARAIAAEAGLRDLTPKEQEDKLVEDAEREPDSGGDQRTTTARPEAEVVSPPEREPSRSAAEARRTRMEAARKIEGSVADVLSHAHFVGYRFRPQVAVGALKLDGLFLAEKKIRHDILLEVRVSARLLFPRAEDRVLAQVARYQAERGRACRAWLIVVATDDAKDGPLHRGADRLEGLENRLDEGLGPLGTASVVEEDGIAKLPELFAEHFGSSQL